MEIASSDESRLVASHQLLHTRPQSAGDDLREKFREAMHQANGPEVSCPLSVQLFFGIKVM